MGKHEACYAISILGLKKSILMEIYIILQIRDFEYSPESHESRKQELEKLIDDQESLRSSLLQWCYTSYGEVLFIIYHIN